MTGVTSTITIAFQVTYWSSLSRRVRYFHQNFVHIISSAARSILALHTDT